MTHLPTKSNGLYNQFFENLDDAFSVMTFDSLFNKLFYDANPAFKKMGFKITGSSNPKINIKEYDSRYEILADIGHLNKEDVKLSMEETSELLVISIVSDKKIKLDDDSGEKYVYRYRELSSNFCNLHRVIYFNMSEIDSKNVTAEFNSGLLKISIDKKTVNKKQEVISKSIEIK